MSINRNMGCVMIRIYRDRSKFKEENILLDNEAFFNNSECDACWVEDCIAIQGDMSPKEKESVCGGKCTFHCKDCKTKDKMQHLNSNSILANW